MARHEVDMVQVARRVLQENGFEPDEPAGLEASIPNTFPLAGALDLRPLAWSSIDNEESRDLDQIEVAVQLGNDAVRVLVGIADVDSMVPKASPVDDFAAVNTTSLYTGIHTFPMLPEQLSTGLTSLLPGDERLAVVTEMVVRADGTLDDDGTKVYVARVVNHAKLVYDTVGAWLTNGANHAEIDDRIAQQLKLQDKVAQRLRRRRHDRGALELETIEARPITENGRVIDLAVIHKNRARELIEDLMIAANQATARYLENRGRSSIRRIVRAPKRWDRIIELARSLGHQLPPEPDPKALAQFLVERRELAPDKFADLSLSVVKLMGPGEYALQRASDPDTGHFGLAVEDYAHSTAPNRRYADLVTQRLLKAASTKSSSPYSDEELTDIARHCTDRENSARKVERTMRKVAAADMLSTKIGQEFDGIVTGATNKGTFVRLVTAPTAEGRIVRGEQGLDVGDKVRVKLLDTEVSRGFIDFERL